MQSSSVANSKEYLPRLLCRLISSSVVAEGRMLALVLGGSGMTLDRAVKQKKGSANDETSCDKFRTQLRDLTGSTGKDELIHLMGGSLE